MKIADFIRRYGIRTARLQPNAYFDTVDDLNMQNKHLRMNDPLHESPGAFRCGVQLKAQKLYYIHGEVPQYALLHEALHMILGPHSMSRGYNEGYLLLPFERAVRETLALSDREARGFRRYQLDTGIGPHIEGHRDDRMPASRYAHDHPFWAAGRARARALGLLDQRDRPTFQRPHWIGSGVPACPSGWTPTVEERKPDHAAV